MLEMTFNIILTVIFFCLLIWHKMSLVSIEVCVYRGGEQEKRIACWWESVSAGRLFNVCLWDEEYPGCGAVAMVVLPRAHREGQYGPSSARPPHLGSQPGGATAFDGQGLPLVTELPREAPNVSNFWKLWNTRQPSGLFLFWPSSSLGGCLSVTCKVVNVGDRHILSMTNSPCDTPLPRHTGVVTGRVFARDSSSRRRETWSSLGLALYSSPQKIVFM